MSNIAIEQGNLRRAFFDRRDTPVQPQAFSLSKVCRAIAEGSRLDGFERELIESANERRGTGGAYMPSQCVPFEVLNVIARRDLTAASASGGGYLTSVAGNAAMVAFDGSIARQLGVQILPGQQHAMTYPKTTAVLPVTWLTLETTPASEQTPTIGQASAAPKVGSAVVDVSGRLLRQGGPLVDAYLNALFLQAAWSALDVALFAGTGTTGQPQGLLTDAGIPSASGTSFNLASAVGIQKTLADAVVSDATARWVGATDVRQTLSQRVAFASTASPLWSDDRLSGRPAMASGRMPAGGLLYGDFSEVQVLLYGAGIEIAADPYTNFAGDIIRFRVLLTMDVVTPRPGALVRITSVT
jgi:HK97 family phage major capsid protein